MPGPKSTKKPPPPPAAQKKATDDDGDKDQQQQQMLPNGLLPSYLADAFSDLYEEDGLVVLGKGLGWLSLLAVFVRFYGDVEEGHASIVAESSGSNQPVKVPLVIVLGLKDNERKALRSVLDSFGTPPELMPTFITNETGQGKDRAAMYKQGGVFCITSRILIVDLLSNIADAKDIDGLLVTHADQVTEQSTEAFILRIFHSQKLATASLGSSNQNSTGFVKAFTDAPDVLMSGFAKVEKILKALRVRRLYLYPRFHDSIRKELEATPPAVDELHQELSPLMKQIQNAIAAAVQGAMRELKSLTPQLEWSSSELSIENCVTTQFDRAVSKQLENEWHKLKPQTKQLVQDLRTLRTLFQSLIQYDCVSFWKFINSIKTMSAASRNPSMWLLTPAADMLFEKAKERIYKIVKGKRTANVEKPVSTLKPVLEETPKWKLLKQVLNEIQEEENKKKETRSEDSSPVTVLVMVKDEKSLDAIKSYLTEGKSRSMMLRWLRYLEQCNDRSRSIADMKGGTSAISEESRLLLEEEGRVRRILFGENRGSGKGSKRKKQLNEIPQFLKKRRRIATEKGRGGLTTSNAEDLQRQAVLDDAIEATEHDMQAPLAKNGETTAESEGVAPHLDEDDLLMFEASADSEVRIVLKSHSSVDGDEAMILLQDLEPSYVVLYDADVAFIRAVEIYSALSRQRKDEPIRVYFLLFEASAEEKTFMKALERERNAFERLIGDQTRMLNIAFQNVETQEMQLAQTQGSVGGTYMNGALPLAFDSRKAGEKAVVRRDIAVDVREFRSALPSILHQRGMRIAPVTLIVGDYVLSSVHCVERKSISDLFGSFQSGRLFDQCTEMSKYYKVPCLLIEFDPNKSFCLQNSNELGVEIKADSICSKMVLLTMSFPKLRILWSKSPHETYKIFRDLKANHDEVDVEKAVQIGRDASEDINEVKEDDDDDEQNDMAIAMLMRLPGVTNASAKKIMRHCDSLAELAEMSREELRKAAGPVTGQKLFTFFRQKLAAT